MPAKSKKQQALMAIAKENPSKVSAKNKGVLEMGPSQLDEFASTPTKTLPKVVKKSKKRKKTPGATDKGQKSQINQMLKGL